MAVTGSQEDYLEAIYILGKEEPVVRVRDLAKFLGVKMASVTGMLRTLASKELIIYKRYGYVLLTDEGKHLAGAVIGKHRDLKEFLTHVLNIPGTEAESVACRMEHSLSAGVAGRLARFVRFVRHCPRCGNDLLPRFKQFLHADRIHAERCEGCVESVCPLLGENKK